MAAVLGLGADGSRRHEIELHDAGEATLAFFGTRAFLVDEREVIALDGERAAALAGVLAVPPRLAERLRAVGAEPEG